MKLFFSIIIVFLILLFSIGAIVINIFDKKRKTNKKYDKSTITDK